MINFAARFQSNMYLLRQQYYIKPIEQAKALELPLDDDNEEKQVMPLD